MRAVGPSMSEAEKPEGFDAVGRMVEVLWPDEGWFTGTITEYNEEDGYHIEFEDGDKEWFHMDADGGNFKFLNDKPRDEVCAHSMQAFNLF